MEAIKGSKGGSKIGVYAKDKFSSELIDAWRKAVKEANFEQVPKDTLLRILSCNEICASFT